MNEATDNQTWVSVDLSEEKNLKDLDNTITIKYMEYAIEVTNDFNKELLADVLRVLKEI